MEAAFSTKHWSFHFIYKNWGLHCLHKRGDFIFGIQEEFKWSRRYFHHRCTPEYSYWTPPVHWERIIEKSITTPCKNVHIQNKTALYICCAVYDKFICYRYKLCSENISVYGSQPSDICFDVSATIISLKRIKSYDQREMFLFRIQSISKTHMVYHSIAYYLCVEVFNKQILTLNWTDKDFPGNMIPSLFKNMEAPCFEKTLFI